MLVLKRRVDESIVIGPDIRIVITEIRRDAVFIAIEAPKSLHIVRSELMEERDAAREHS